MAYSTLLLVLIVSSAHAMVHVFELSFPSVEQLVAADYGVGKREMGLLGNCWRLPFGFGAMLAGWLTDRYGAKWLLAIYLLGCSACCSLASLETSLPTLFVIMFAMGSFASIYHPAGLALISHATSPQNRPMALGIHGVLGSLGIAMAPFLAGAMLTTFTWRQYYRYLALPGGVLAIVIALFLVERHRNSTSGANSSGNSAAEEPDEGNWRAFFVLCLVGMIAGFVYAGLMNFLVRYLSGLELRPDRVPAESFRNYLTGGVLLIGMAGQFIGGWVGRSGRLERQLAAVLLALVPLLVAMAFAEGTMRLVAAGAVMLVQFMQQPLYNSLVAQYVPRRRRSLGYGFSNTLAFGMGSFGATFVGFMPSDRLSYGSLAVLVYIAAMVAGRLERMRK